MPSFPPPKFKAQVGYGTISLAFTAVWVLNSLISRLSQNTNMYHRESLVFFLCKHDVIKIGLKQKGNVLRVVQPTMHSMLNVYDIQPPITR